MEKATYIQEQMKRIDSAVKIAHRAKEISSEIHDFFQNSQKAVTPKAEDFAEDTFKYFDTNYVQGQLEKLRLSLDDLKKKLIEVKIENDKLLFEGGFLLCIDKKIDDIFLSNTLCLLQADDDNTSRIMDDTITKLTDLKAELEEGL